MFSEFTVSEAMWAMGGFPISRTNNLASKITGISTDTRSIKAGELFFALTGKNFDGHSYIEDAAAKGAAGIVVSRKSRKIQNSSTPIIFVRSTLYAFSKLATWYLRRFNVRKIALTGSVGKTTTREMITAILQTKGEVLQNYANENNLIGVPKTVFKLQPEHRFAVLELGTNFPGEIARLTQIAQPDCAVLLNVLPVHLEGLGSLRGVMREKAALLRALNESNIAIVNFDNLGARIASEQTAAKVISFGKSKLYNIRASEIKTEENKLTFTLNEKFRFEIPVAGEHNVYNALAAIAVGALHGVSTAEMQKALAEFKPVKLRAELELLAGALIINDCYNANPQSTIAAIDTLAKVRRKHKIAVIGDMLELGEQAVFYHRQVARKIVESDISFLITVGELSKEIHEFVKVHSNIKSVHVLDAERAALILYTQLNSDAAVLIKGSRGLKLERVIERLKLIHNLSACRKSA